MRIDESTVVTAIFVTGILIASYLGGPAPSFAPAPAQFSAGNYQTPGIYAPAEEN